MVQAYLKVNNKNGLHLRPAGNICKESIKYNCKIEIISRSSIANAKSVLSILGICIKYGDDIEIRCDGQDEIEALEALTILADNNFGEKE